MVLAGCGEKLSPEDQVRQFVVAGTAAVEARDVLRINDLISEKYLDKDGRDHQQLLRLATGYFLRNKNIHVFTQIKNIHFPVMNQAELQLYAAMAGSPVSGVEALLNLRADLYLFDFTLVREGDKWMLKSLQWQRASVENFAG